MAGTQPAEDEQGPRGPCEGLLRALGWAGMPPGTTLEDGGAALVWDRGPRVEWLARGSGTAAARRAAFERWQYGETRPAYVVLCDLAEVVVYAFERQVHEPLDRVALAEVGPDCAALGFMAPVVRAPVFRNDRVAATAAALQRLEASFVAELDDGAPRELARARVLERAVIAVREDPRVQPALLGALLQRTMDSARRHALGAHFTRESDIARVVLPTIERPWREQIDRASRADELLGLCVKLAEFRVLDPACGSGDFLCAAYRALRELERELISRLAGLGVDAAPAVSPRQLFGIDRDPLAVAATRASLRIAAGAAPPDENLREGDALLMAWPAAHAIVGNPPFQAKNKMQAEFGSSYVAQIRRRYPQVPGGADYCVYWFRRAHEELPPGGRAGLVGTNTIRQNASRAGGLEFIAASGEIVEAVASQPWAGDAAVHVSVVNWIKEAQGPTLRRLSWQVGDARDSPWRCVTLARIGPSLSPHTDVSAARPLAANVQARRCFQGQTHGHRGFLLTAEEAAAMRAAGDGSGAVVYPLLVGDDLLGRADGGPSRYIIDFGECSQAQAQARASAYRRIEARVKPDREAACRREAARGGSNRHHAAFLRNWWRLSWGRPELLAALAPLRRYLVCVRLSRRPVFEFVSATVRPGDALIVFTLDDDYSFGVLQSSLHHEWLVARCSTLKADPRYTSSSVFDAFPWPQAATRAQIEAVAGASRALRATRAALLPGRGGNRRALYRSIAGAEDPLQMAHDRLDRAVTAAYGFAEEDDRLGRLLALNLELARGGAAVGPGLPGCVPAEDIRSTDCIGAETRESEVRTGDDLR